MLLTNFDVFRTETVSFCNCRSTCINNEFVCGCCSHIATKILFANDVYLSLNYVWFMYSCTHSFVKFCDAIFSHHSINIYTKLVCTRVVWASLKRDWAFKRSLFLSIQLFISDIWYNGGMFLGIMSTNNSYSWSPVVLLHMQTHHSSFGDFL